MKDGLKSNVIEVKEDVSNRLKYLELEKELLKFLRDSYDYGEPYYNEDLSKEIFKKFKKIGYIRTKEIQYKFIFENKNLSPEKFSRLIMFIEGLNNRTLNFKKEEIEKAKIYNDTCVTAEYAIDVLDNFFKKDYQFLFNLTKLFSDYEYNQILVDCIYIIKNEGYEDYLEAYEQLLFITDKKYKKEKIKKDIIEDIKNLFDVSYIQFLYDKKFEFHLKADYSKVKYKL